MNLVEKILAKASGRRQVTAGEIVVADVDCLLLHDLSGYLTSRVFENEVRKRLIVQIEDATGGRVEIAAFHWRLLHLEAEADGVGDALAWLAGR